MMPSILGFAGVILSGGFFCAISYGAFLKFWTRYNREALMGMTAVFLKENLNAVLDIEELNLPTPKKLKSQLSA